MKLKYYLRGLGTGILVTTIILMIAFSAKSDNYNKVNLAEKETESTTTTEKTSKNKSETKTTNIKSSDKETTTVEATTTAEATTTIEATTREIATPEVTTALPQHVEVMLDIYSGMSSNQVARQLESLGVIKNNEEFNDYLCDNNMQNKIKVGQYKISQGSSYEDIASMIIK